MAAADYKLCDNCGRKTFYDAALEYPDPTPPTYQYIPDGVGDWAVICEPCAKTYICVVMERSALPQGAQER